MSHTRPRFSYGFALAAIVLSLFGCGDDSPTKPTPVSQDDSDDAAQQVGYLMSDGNGSLSGYQLGAGGDARGSNVPRIAPEGGSVSETTFVAGNITWTLVRTWYDGAGNVQASYNPLTTLRMTASARAHGTVESASDSASFGSAGTLDVRGVSILRDTLTVNATRRDTLQASFVPSFRAGRIYAYVEGSGVLTNVIRLKPVLTNRWPVSGTATWLLKIDRLASNDRNSVTRHYEVAISVTFNGTQMADVAVTGGYRYKLNLQTGVVARV